MSLKNLYKEDSETLKQWMTSFKKTTNGENVIYNVISVRYQLDMLNKEWNQIGDAIKNKKKANKNDPCAEEL